MRLLRWGLSIAIVILAAWAIDALCLSLYEVNLEKREIADRTNEAYAKQESARAYAGRLALRNADDLEPWEARFPMDADLHLIRAANLRLIGRTYEAARSYATAVHYQPTPELYLNLGETQIGLGLVDEGRANVLRAVAFNPDLMPTAEKLLTTAAQSTR